MEKQGIVNLNVNTSSKTPKVETKIRFSSLDVNSAKLIFNVTKEGAPLPLSTAKGILDLRMMDGSTFDELPVKITDAAKGVMEYSLTTEQLKHTGTAQAELSVTYENGQGMSISKFEFKIDKALRDQDIAVKAEHYIKDIDDLKKHIETIADDIEGLDVLQITARLEEMEEKLEDGAIGVDEQARQGIQEVTAALAEMPKTINGISPDEDGDIQIEVPDVDTTNLATKQDIQQLSLTFKESYPTLTDLETAYPNGGNSNHVVLSDGMIYTYKDGWISTGIQGVGTGVADKSISAKQTDFINVSQSVNLYNTKTQTLSTITPNALFNTNGTIGTGTGAPYISYFILAPIYLKPGVYSSNKTDIHGTLAENRRAWIFDVSNNPIAPVNNLSNFTIPENGHYIRIGIYNGGWGHEVKLNQINVDMMIVKGNTLPDKFVPYENRVSLSDSIEVPKAITAERFADPVKAIIKPLHVNFTNGVLNVISKYSSTKDIQFTLTKKGVNNIFDFKEIKLIDNTTSTVSNNINGGVAYATFLSDSFSPHVVRVINNPTGDLPNSYQFTGGNHGYNNTGDIIDTNKPTGRTTDISLKVEGRKVTTYDGFAEFIEVEWTNRVQAANTTKADGTGREVLIEKHKMIYNGIEWKAQSEITALEDLWYVTYYGYQFQTSKWNGGIFYHTSPIRLWNTNNASASNSGDTSNKLCNMVTIKDPNSTHFVDISLDSRFGIGTKELVPSNEPSAFQTTYHKVYWNLIKNMATQTAAGTIYTFKGGYKFYSA